MKSERNFLTDSKSNCNRSSRTLIGVAENDWGGSIVINHFIKNK